MTRIFKVSQKSPFNINDVKSLNHKFSVKNNTKLNSFTKPYFFRSTRNFYTEINKSGHLICKENKEANNILFTVFSKTKELRKIEKLQNALDILQFAPADDIDYHLAIIGCSQTALSIDFEVIKPFLKLNIEIQLPTHDYSKIKRELLENIRVAVDAVNKCDDQKSWSDRIKQNLEEIKNEIQSKKDQSKKELSKSIKRIIKIFVTQLKDITYLKPSEKNGDTTGHAVVMYYNGEIKNLHLPKNGKFLYLSHGADDIPKCKLYLIESELPALDKNSDHNYHGSYIFIKAKTELFYTKKDGQYEKVEIIDMKKFEEFISRKSNQKHLNLTFEEIEKFITSNGGHIPDNIEKRYKDIFEPKNPYSILESYGHNLHFYVIIDKKLLPDWENIKTRITTKKTDNFDLINMNCGQAVYFSLIGGQYNPLENKFLLSPQSVLTKAILDLLVMFLKKDESIIDDEEREERQYLINQGIRDNLYKVGLAKEAHVIGNELVAKLRK